MFKIVKWFVILLVVVVVVYILAFNRDIIFQPVAFQMEIPFQGMWTSPDVALGTILAVCILIGGAVTGLAGIVKIFGLRRELKAARRRVADLEDEVVAYRGRAARESDRDEDEDE